MPRSVHENGAASSAVETTPTGTLQGRKRSWLYWVVRPCRVQASCRAYRPQCVRGGRFKLAGVLA